MKAAVPYSSSTRGALIEPGAEQHGYVFSGARPGINAQFQPTNPGAVNALPVQGVQSFVNANDLNPTSKAALYDRHALQQCFVPAIDVRNYQYTMLDANTNKYNPRRFPEPSCALTAYPARRLVPAGKNGSTNAYNPPNPFGMPPSGTNNVAFIVTCGL